MQAVIFLISKTAKFFNLGETWQLRNLEAFTPVVPDL